MLKVLTKQEELAWRAERFAQLQTGMVFDLGRANIDRILQGKPCAHSRLRDS